MQVLKRYAWRILKLIKLSAPLLLLKDSVLASEGWYRSYYSEQAVDAEGRAIPWYTYPAIHFLEQRLTHNHRVFEYGCGNSTMWYAARTASVIAVEHDPKWAKKIATGLPSSARVVYKDLDNGYVEEITQHGSFDVVVVDGRKRSQCGLTALQSLKPAGVIVWDNSERPQYAEAIRSLRSTGFREISFQGMTPIVPYSSQTSILYRPNNCLEI